MGSPAPVTRGGIPPLDTLGPRIMVIGPTNAGKSTLADAIGRKLGLAPVHIDLLKHCPDGHWISRPVDEFHELHDAAIARDHWILDGNYTELFPRRLASATGIVVIDAPLMIRVLRYIKRTLSQKRIGGLRGVKEQITYEMLHWLWITRHKAREHARIARESGLPYAIATTQAELADLRTAWLL